ncbi:MAG TPA: LPXTG cell wall anchor domain-containing protein [Candidatus Angelobacter sp.]
MSYAKSLRYVAMLVVLFVACALVAQQSAQTGTGLSGGRLEIKGVKGSDIVYLNGQGPDFKIGTVKDTQTGNVVLPPGQQHVILVDPNGDKKVYSGYVQIKAGQKATLHVDKSDSYYEAWTGPAMQLNGPAYSAGTSGASNAGEGSAGQGSVTPVSYKVHGLATPDCQAELEIAGPPGYALLKVDDRIVSKQLPPTGLVPVDPGTTYRVEWFSRWGVHLSDPQTVVVDRDPHVTLTAPSEVVNYHRIGERVVEDPTVNLHWSAKNANSIQLIDPMGETITVPVTGGEGDLPVKFMPASYDPEKGWSTYKIKATSPCRATATEVATVKWHPTFDPEVVAQVLPPVLPKTGSPLPLLALLGFGSMLSALALRKFRKG